MQGIMKFCEGQFNTQLFNTYSELNIHTYPSLDTFPVPFIA